MKIILGLSLALTSFFAIGETNLSDAIDKNQVPAENEIRKNEAVNKADALDGNSVPNTLEDRQNEEEWRDDYQEDQQDTKKRQNKMKENEEG